MPYHARDLCLVIGLDTSESGSDSEFSTQSARMITINEVRGDPLEVNKAYAMDDIFANKSSEEEVPLPQRSARHKSPALGCHLCDHDITGGGVVKLKGRTRRLLPPMSQPGSSLKETTSDVLYMQTEQPTFMLIQQ